MNQLELWEFYGSSSIYNLLLFTSLWIGDDRRQLRYVDLFLCFVISLNEIIVIYSLLGFDCRSVGLFCL